MTAPTIPPARLREPTTLLPLRWGGYRERLWGGLLLIVGGGLSIAGSNTFVLLLLWIGTVVHLFGWHVIPSAGWRRIVAAGPSTAAMWLLLTLNPRYLIVLVLPYLGWLLVRHRPLSAYATIVFVLAGAITLGELFEGEAAMLPALAIESAIMVGSAWIARSIAARTWRNWPPKRGTREN